MEKHLHLRLWLVLVTLSLLSSPIFSQCNITGMWKGFNTQDSKTCYSKEYDFELYLKQNGNVVFGRSYANVGDIYAEMEIVGELKEDKYFYFQETKIIDFKAESGMEWCVKRGVLTIIRDGDQIRLEGTWKGNTSFSSCIPGKVYLEKIDPKA